MKKRVQPGNKMYYEYDVQEVFYPKWKKKSFFIRNEIKRVQSGNLCTMNMMFNKFNSN